MRRGTVRTAGIALTGAVAATAVAVGCIAAAQPTPEPAAAPTHQDAAVTVRVVQTRLAGLEAQADAAGVVAQKADEAVLDRDTAANRAAAGRAEAGLAALAAKQTPELTSLLTRLTALGVHPEQTDGTTATTTAKLVGKTRALRAVSFARKQIGDPYGFADAGPGHWDCSGLTMGSYRAVKVSIGGHSATAQWRLAKQHHRLHAYKHREVGDLIFYGVPGDVYHVAIYAGHNRMIEAPYPGKRVREVPVRAAGRLAQVARPA